MRWMIVAIEPEPRVDLTALATLARTGDREAFGRLAEAHQARLYGQALAMCGDHGLAEDLVVETLAAAWSGVGRFRGGCRFSTWLYGILLHRHQKQLRRCRSRPPSLASLPASAACQLQDQSNRSPDPTPAVWQGLVAQEEAARLRAALDGLPPPHRTVLLLRFFEEASLSEIAAALEIPTGTVKSRLYHGLEMLRHDPGLMNFFAAWRNS